MRGGGPGGWVGELVGDADGLGRAVADGLGWGVAAWVIVELMTGERTSVSAGLGVAEGAGDIDGIAAASGLTLRAHPEPGNSRIRAARAHRRSKLITQAQFRITIRTLQGEGKLPDWSTTVNCSQQTPLGMAAVLSCSRSPEPTGFRCVLFTTCQAPGCSP